MLIFFFFFGLFVNNIIGQKKKKKQPYKSNGSGIEAEKRIVRRLAFVFNSDSVQWLGYYSHLG